MRKKDIVYAVVACILLSIFALTLSKVNSLITFMYLMSLIFINNCYNIENVDPKMINRRFLFIAIGMGILHFSIVYVIDNILMLNNNMIYLMIEFISSLIYIVIIQIVGYLKYEKILSINTIIIKIGLLLAILLIYLTDISHVLMYLILLISLVNGIIIAIKYLYGKMEKKLNE